LNLFSDDIALKKKIFHYSIANNIKEEIHNLKDGDKKNKKEELNYLKSAKSLDNIFSFSEIFIRVMKELREEF
jgi:hypothetical protein